MRDFLKLNTLNVGSKKYVQNLSVETSWMVADRSKRIAGYYKHEMNLPEMDMMSEV